MLLLGALAVAVTARLKGGSKARDFRRINDASSALPPTADDDRSGGGELAFSRKFAAPLLASE